MEKGGISVVDEGWCSCGRKLDMYEIVVSPTTGGQFHLRVAASDSVEYLRRLVSKRLRVPKDRICLLYRDRHLRAGSLEENYILEGARITLLPSVETGLLSQRPEQSVMQALESLNDAQVNDFLTGKAPLNLTMRLGDHMMLIQLQLSTVSPTGGKKSSSRYSSSSSSSHHHHHHHHHFHHHHHHHSSPCSSGGSDAPSARTAASTSSSSQPSPHHHHHHHHYHTVSHHQFSPSTPPPGSGSLQGSRSASSPSPSPAASPTASPSCLSFDTDLPIRGCPHQAEDADPKASLDTKALAEASRNLTQTLKQLSSEVLTTKPADKESKSSCSRRKASEASSAAAAGSSQPSGSAAASASSGSSGASSKGSSASASASSRRQGAIIESMQHHGKGVYSGTFSGTLNPALQDRHGRPKRDISTIIHILNDLLCATPQYRRHSGSASYTLSAPSAGGSTFTPVVRVSSAASAHHQYHHPAKSHHAARHRESSSAASGSVGPDVAAAAESSSAGLASSRVSCSDEDDSSVDDNQVTRSKLEHLRFIMEQRRARRKARREARASPYAAPDPDAAGNTAAPTSWSSEATTVVASKSPPDAPAAAGLSDAPQTPGEDSADPAALRELNSGTVVA